MSRWIKLLLTNPKGLLVMVLVALYVAGWILNATKGTHFDLPELRQFIGVVSNLNIFDIGGQ